MTTLEFFSRIVFALLISRIEVVGGFEYRGLVSWSKNFAHLHLDVKRIPKPILSLNDTSQSRLVCKDLIKIMQACRDIYSNPAKRASHVAILHQKLRRAICHKTSSNFLFSFRLCFSTFPHFMDFFTTRAPNVSEREGGLEGYWLTIILKRFTWGRKAASRAVKCEQWLGLFSPMFDTQIRGKFMENLGQKSTSSSYFAPNQWFKCQMVLLGPGFCVSGFRRVITRIPTVI